MPPPAPMGQVRSRRSRAVCSWCREGSSFRARARNKPSRKLASRRSQSGRGPETCRLKPAQRESDRCPTFATPVPACRGAYCGFPVELVGADELHAAFLNESRTRGCWWCPLREIRIRGPKTKGAAQRTLWLFRNGGTHRFAHLPFRIITPVFAIKLQKHGGIRNRHGCLKNHDMECLSHLIDFGDDLLMR
jgi:hypothetical protein